MSLILQFLNENSMNNITFANSLRKEVVINIERLNYRINDFLHTDDMELSFKNFANELSISEIKRIFNSEAAFLSQYKKLRNENKNEFLDLISQIVENVDRIKKDSEDATYMNKIAKKRPSGRAQNLKIKFEKLKETLDAK